MRYTLVIAALAMLAGCGIRNGYVSPNAYTGEPEHPIVTQCRFRSVHTDWLTEIRLTRQCVEFVQRTGVMP